MLRLEHLRLAVRSSWFIKDGYVLAPSARVPKKRGTQSKSVKAAAHHALRRRITARR